MNLRVGTKLPALLLMVSAVALCSTFAAGTNTIPQRFRSSIGGFLGATYNVEFRDGLLYYLAAEGLKKNQPVKITPSVQQWREFRRALDDLNIWQWRTNYPNSRGVRDGTQWSVEIEYSDRFLKTQGDNNFPGRGGKPSGSPSYTKAFSGYTTAVRKLLGGKEFQ